MWHAQHVAEFLDSGVASGLGTPTDRDGWFRFRDRDQKAADGWCCCLSIRTYQYADET